VFSVRYELKYYLEDLQTSKGININANIEAVNAVDVM
jgi:hypothetical protein